MVVRIREHDWSATSLGPLHRWPQSLKTIIDAILARPGPATVLWGPQHIEIYNDAYIAIARERHPALLGKPFSVGWADCLDAFFAPLSAALAGRATQLRDYMRIVNGPAGPEERIFDADWSPLRDESGAVTGSLQTLVETTARHRAEAALNDSEERHAFLLSLTDRLGKVSDPDVMMAISAELFGRKLGLAVACFLLLDADEDGYEIAGAYSDGRTETGLRTHGRLSVDWPDRGAEFRAGEAVFSDDQAIGRVADAQAPTLFGEGSGSAVPLIRDGRMVALFSSAHPEPRHWTASEKRLQKEVAERTWAAVEKARIEAALRESQARLAAAFESVPVGVAVLDLNGRIVIANAEYRKFLPSNVIPSRDVDRRWRWRAWDDEGRPIAPENFPAERSLRGERVFPGQEMLHTDDESRERWTRVASVPIFDASGATTGTASVISDIDAFKHSEAAVRESEERLRQFGEASQDVLWIRDAETLQWIYLTPAFDTIYGLTRKEALSGNNYSRWIDLIVPEDREHATQNIQRVRGGEHVTFDYRIRRPIDGAIRWLRNTDFPIAGASGEIVLIGGIGHDMTEVKAVQDRLSREEERLRNAIEVAHLGLWDWDVQTGQVHWSDQHFRLEGYEVGEITPSYEAWISRVHPEDREPTEAALRQSMQDRREFSAEFRVVHPDGSVHWLFGRGHFSYDEAGTPTRMGGAIMDVTDRREWEERQSLLVAELQHRTRNLIGVVHSMADKTAASSADIEDFRERFRVRLAALARVQGLLSRLNEHDRVTFDDLINTELAAMDGDAERVTLEGPTGVRLRSSTVQTLAMAIHELATNAVKYGALGQPKGSLFIRWTLEPDGEDGEPWLHIDWKESGVTMAPSGAGPRGTGQGRELIERALPYQLKARTSYNLGHDGVHCTISIPVSSRIEQENKDG